MKEIEVKIDGGLSGKTVREILFSHLFLTSRLVTRLKRDGGIILNGENVTVRRTVADGDVLKIIIKSDGSQNIKPQNIPIDIIYEDEDIIAVNKPPDMPTHPSAGHFGGTLANALMYCFRNTDFTFRAVNRLDRDTTGLVLIAKNQYSAGYLNRQLMNREIEKTYNAICCGIFGEKSGIIEAPIKRESGSVIKRVAAADGQYAKSEYRVIRTENGFSLVCLKPYTGRTHQLRVHMAYNKTPIFGDFMYGEEVDGERTRLHCRSLRFRRPSDGEEIFLEAPLPMDFFIK